MKKNSLFKVILMLLLLVVIATYCINGREGAKAYLGLADVGVNFVQSFYYFFDTLVFVLVVGGFYGVLNKTGAYKKLLDTIVTKVKPFSKQIIFATIAFFAVVTSLTGITMQLIILVPFVISIVLLLGYDKLVAISSTVISILVGFIGGIFLTFRDPNNYYGYGATTFEEFLKIGKNINLFPKILLLILAIGLLIYYVNNHIKSVEKKKVKYEINDNTDILIAEVKGNYKNIKIWPLITILSLILVLLILGLMPWESLFNVHVFADFHTWLTGLTINEFAVFPNVISKNITAFGNWASAGVYLMPTLILFFFAIIIKFVYKIKFDDAIEGFVDGAKKMLPAGIMMILSFTVLVSAYNSGFVETIIKAAGERFDGIGLVLGSIISMLGSLLNVDIYYTVSGTFSPIVAVISDEAILPVMALAFQSIYGLVSIIGPTSLLLILVLTYLDVPYTSWLKYIWRFVLQLFVIIFVILLIVFLI